MMRHIKKDIRLIFFVPPFDKKDMGEISRGNKWPRQIFLR